MVLTAGESRVINAGRVHHSGSRLQKDNLTNVDSVPLYVTV